MRINITPTTFNDGEVILSLPEESITLTKEQYELLLSRRVDKFLSQIVSPLNSNRVDDFKMTRANQELVKVNFMQREYFDYQEVFEERTREGTEITGTLNSLTKTNRRGTFHTTDGVHVPYKYVGGDDAQLLRGFSSRETVKVFGRIKFDGDGVPTSIEIQDIGPLQRNLLDQ